VENIIAFQSYGQQNYGILFAKGKESSHDFCVMFNPRWGPPWTTDLDQAVSYSCGIILILYVDDICGFIVDF